MKIVMAIVMAIRLFLIMERKEESGNERRREIAMNARHAARTEFCSLLSDFL